MKYLMGLCAAVAMLSLSTLLLAEETKATVGTASLPINTTDIESGVSADTEEDIHSDFFQLLDSVSVYNPFGLLLGGVIAFFGVRATKNGITSLFNSLVAFSSKGEVIGSLLFIVGGMMIVNAMTYVLDGSFLAMNLLGGGAISSILGLGVACESAERRRKNS